MIYLIKIDPLFYHKMTEKIGYTTDNKRKLFNLPQSVKENIIQDEKQLEHWKEKIKRRQNCKVVYAIVRDR